MHRYAEIPLPATGIPNVYTIKGWKIVVVRSPILSSGEIDAATDKLKIPMPEMIFGNNYLELSYCPDDPTYHDDSKSSFSPDSDQQSATDSKRKDVWSLRFDTYNALDRVNKTGTHMEGGLLQVAHSKTWQKSTERAALERPDEIQGIIKPYDWTYTTDYKGDVTFGDADNNNTNNGDEGENNTTKHEELGKFKETVPEDGDLYIKRGIPFEKLKVQDPIHFFDQVILYEDELGDNGIATYYIKVRVMANRLLLLSRLFLRVDGVIFRVRDSRVYVEFNYECTMNPGENPDTDHPDSKHIGQPYVVREYTEHEASYDNVRQMVPKNSRDYSVFLRDYDWIAAHIPVKKKTREYCFLPKYNGPNVAPAAKKTEQPNKQEQKPFRKVVPAGPVSSTSGSTEPKGSANQNSLASPKPSNPPPGVVAATPGTTTIPYSLMLPVSGSRIPPGATRKQV